MARRVDGFSDLRPDLLEVDLLGVELTMATALHCVCISAWGIEDARINEVSLGLPTTKEFGCASTECVCRCVTGITVGLKYTNAGELRSSDCDQSVV